MKLENSLLLLSLAMLAALFGCQKKTDAAFQAQGLEVDERYLRQLEFKFIGVTIPIVKDSVFVRIDPPVSNIEIHTEKLLTELGVDPKSIVYTNPALKGRAMHLRFSDGKECSFIWTLKENDPKLTSVVIEHEKYHALCRVAQESVDKLSRAIREKGFELDLTDYEEELSATLVEILSLHLQGLPLEDISGSEYVIRAVEILKKNRSNQS